MGADDTANATDLVTQIQDNLGDLCAMFFNFAGALQRDAAPISTSGEVVTDISTARPKHDVQAMASQIAQASKQLDELIGQLPTLDEAEQEQLQKILRLKVGGCQLAQHALSEQQTE